MASHTHDVLRRAVWASLTGGYCYDPSFDLFFNTLAAWIVYACLIGILFIALKVTNYRLHTTFDQKVIQRVEEVENVANQASSELVGENHNAKVRTPDLEMQPLTPVELSSTKDAVVPDSSEVECHENNNTAGDSVACQARRVGSRSTMLQNTAAAHTSFFAMEDETMITGPDNTAQLESMSLNPTIILGADAKTNDHSSLRQRGLRASSVGSSENTLNSRRNNHRDRNRNRATAFDLKVEVHQARDGNNVDELTSLAPKFTTTSPDAVSLETMREKLYAVGSMEQLPDDSDIRSSSNLLLASDMRPSYNQEQQTCVSTNAVNLNVPVVTIEHENNPKPSSGGSLALPPTTKASFAVEGDVVWKLRHASSSGMPWSRRPAQRAQLAEGRSATSVTNQPSASMETILSTFVRPTNHLEEQTEALLRPPQPMLNEIEPTALGFVKQAIADDKLPSARHDATVSSSHAVRVNNRRNIAQQPSDVTAERKMRRAKSQTFIPVSLSLVSRANATVNQLPSSLRDSRKFGSNPELRTTPQKDGVVQQPQLLDANKNVAENSSGQPVVTGSSSADDLEAAFVRFLQTYPNDVSIPPATNDADTVQQLITARLPLSGILARSAYDSNTLRQMLSSHFDYISGHKHVINPVGAKSTSSFTGPSTSVSNTASNKDAHNVQTQPPLCWPYDRLAPHEVKALLETREANDRRPQHPPPSSGVASNPHVADLSEDDDGYVEIAPQSLLALTSQSNSAHGHQGALWTSMPGLFNTNNTRRPHVHDAVSSGGLTIPMTVSAPLTTTATAASSGFGRVVMASLATNLSNSDQIGVNEFESARNRNPTADARLEISAGEAAAAAVEQSAFKPRSSRKRRKRRPAVSVDGEVDRQQHCAASLEAGVGTSTMAIKASESAEKSGLGTGTVLKATTIGTEAVVDVQSQHPQAPARTSVVSVAGGSAPVLSRQQQWSFRSHSSSVRHTDADYQSSDSSLSPGSSHVDKMPDLLKNHRAQQQQPRLHASAADWLGRNSLESSFQSRNESDYMLMAPPRARNIEAEEALEYFPFGRRRSSADAAFGAAAATASLRATHQRATLPQPFSMLPSIVTTSSAAQPPPGPPLGEHAVEVVRRLDNALAEFFTPAVSLDSRRQQETLQQTIFRLENRYGGPLAPESAVAVRGRAAESSTTFYTRAPHRHRVDDDSDYSYLNVAPLSSRRRSSNIRSGALRAAPRFAAVRGGRASSTGSAVASSVAAAIVRYPFAQRLRNAEQRRQRQQRTVTQPVSSSRSRTTMPRTSYTGGVQPRPPSPHPVSGNISPAFTLVPPHTRNERMPLNVARRSRNRSSGFDSAGVFTPNSAEEDVAEATFLLSNRGRLTRRHLFGRQQSAMFAADRPPPVRTSIVMSNARDAGRSRRRRLRPPREALQAMRNADGTVNEEVLDVFSRLYAGSESRDDMEVREGDEQYDHLFYEDVPSGDEGIYDVPFAGAARPARSFLEARSNRLVHDNFAYRPPTTRFTTTGMMLTPPHTAINLSGLSTENDQQHYANIGHRGHLLSIGADFDADDETNSRHLFDIAPASWRHLWFQSRLVGEPDRRTSEKQQTSNSLVNEISDFNRQKLRHRRPFYKFNWLPLPFKKLLNGRRGGVADEADDGGKVHTFLKNLRQLTSTRIRFDRIALLSLMDRDKSLCMLLGALFATLFTCFFAWLILSQLEFYHDLEVLIFCLVVASCQYSLIKSVQPDAVSPTHGFNYYTVFSRAVYFCLLCGLAVGFQWIGNNTNEMQSNLSPSSVSNNDDSFYLSNDRLYAADTVFDERSSAFTTDFYYRGTSDAGVSAASCSSAASFLPTLAPALDRNQMFGFEFNRIHIYARWASSLVRIILLLFPIIFTYGLLPQVPTFIMAVCQETDVHVFGGDSPTSTITAVVNVALSAVAAAGVFAVGYLAVLAMPSAVELHELLTTQQQQLHQLNNNNFVSSNDFAARNLVVSVWVALIVVVAFCLSRSTIKLADLWRGAVRLLLSSDAASVSSANDDGPAVVAVENEAATNVTTMPLVVLPLSDNLSGSDGEYPASISNKGLSDFDIKSDIDVDDADVEQKLLTTSKSAPEICASSLSNVRMEENLPTNIQRHSDTPQTQPAALAASRFPKRKRQPKRKRTTSLKPTSAVDEREQLERRKLINARLQSDVLCSAVMFLIVFGLHASGLFSQPRELARLACTYEQQQNEQNVCPLFDAGEQTRFAALYSSNIFDRLRLALLLFTCLVGVLLHYVLVEMRMENPWLSFTRPFFRSHEYAEFEPRRVARLMPFERVFVLLTFFERYVLYTLCAMAFVWNDAWILTHKLNSVVFGALLVTLAAGKFLRQAYSSTHRQFIVLGLTLLFFQCDARHLSSGAFLLDAFVMAFVVDKLEELYLKFTFVLAYIAPWQITWGSAFHAFAQPFSLPHTMMLVAMAVISTALNAPLTPFLGSAIFLTSYSRPQKFWEKNYHTTRWDASNLRLAQQVGETGGGAVAAAVAAASNESSPRNAAAGGGGGGAVMQDDANLNSIFYENLCNALRERLAGEIALGRWGHAGRGDFFILASENLNCMVHIIGMANGAVTFQLRGLEFRGTYCQQREVEAISENIDSKSQCCLGVGACRALCCACFCTKCSLNSNPFRNLPRFLTIGASFSLRCLAWRVAAVKLIIPGYSVSDNSATAMLQMHDLRRNMLTLLTKSIIYFLTRHKSLPEWIGSLFAAESALAESHHQPTHVDLDSLFTQHFDDDYDDMVGGVSRVRFVQVYEQWLKFCCQKSKPHPRKSLEPEENVDEIADKTNADVYNADATSKLTTLCYALSILVRRALAVAANRSAAHNIDMFLYGLHTLFKGDFRIQAAQDEWIFGAFDLMSDVLQPALRMSVKLHQDHFSYGDDWLTSCDALYDAIETNERECVICHEADPAWRRNIAANFPTLVSLRHHITDDTNHEYKFIMLTHKPLAFRLIAINRECVRGFWAGQLQELIYLRNRNPERGSIQNAKQVLRNIINSSCDQPIGYPIYVSPLITSYAETHADIRQILGGPITVKSVRTCLRNMWNGIYTYCSAGCLSGGGGGLLSGLANSANNSRRQQQQQQRVAAAGDSSVYAAGRVATTGIPSSAAQVDRRHQRMWLLAPPSAADDAESGHSSTLRTPENIPLKTLASAASRSLTTNTTLGEASTSGGMTPSLLHIGKTHAATATSTTAAAPFTRRLFFEHPITATAVSAMAAGGLASTARAATLPSGNTVKLTAASSQQPPRQSSRKSSAPREAPVVMPPSGNDRVFSNSSNDVGGSKMIEMMPMTSSKTTAEERPQEQHAADTSSNEAKRNKYLQPDLD